MINFTKLRTGISFLREFAEGCLIDDLREPSNYASKHAELLPDLYSLINDISHLNENAGEIGEGKLKNLVAQARQIQKKAKDIK